MSEAAKKRATYEDVLSAPENHVAQILDGELHVHPRPARRHLRAASALGARLVHEFDAGPTGAGGAWVILFEPELHLGGDVLVPDLAGWRRTTMPELPEVAYFTVAPDWICDVLSAATARLDRGNKLEAYAREGVPVVWLIDPESKTLEIFTLEARTSLGPRYVLAAVHGGDDIVHAEPFASFALRLAGLWER